MSRVGVPNERARGIRRRWAPEALELRPMLEQSSCRVCGGMIERGDAIWRWRWRSTEVGHGACGWFTERDPDGVTALTWVIDSLGAPAAVERAAELGLITTIKVEGVREHRLSLVGRALWVRLGLGCSCGAALRWAELPLVGLQDDGQGGHLELKNCPKCGSTRARRAA